MSRFSPQRLSQLAMGVLLLVIIRSLSEYFRLEYVYGPALTPTQVTPYVAGALFANLALALALVCHIGERYRASIGVVIATVLLLLVYKFLVLG